MGWLKRRGEMCESMDPPAPQLLPHLHGPDEQQHQGAGHHPPLPLLGHLPGGLHQVKGVDGSPLQRQPSVHCICPGRLHQTHIQVLANPSILEPTFKPLIFV